MQEIEGTIKKILKREKIEKIIRQILIVLIIFTLFFTVLIEYAFKMNLFRQAIIITFNLIVISVFVYFYINPKFIVQKRKEILLLIACILIFLIFMEVTLRIKYCGGAGEDREFFPDEELKYKYETSKKLCNYVLEGKKFYYRSNNEGFIDEDFEFKEGDYNIFLIGDSMAACLESDYNNCVHQKLEKDLKKEYGENINIMNFGVSAYGGLAELAVLKTYKDVYKPKMIILYFLAQNDISDNRDYLTKEYVNSKTREIIREITPRTFLFVITNGKNILDKILMRFEPFHIKGSLEAQVMKNYDAYLKEYDAEWQNLLEIELDALGEIYDISLEENITLLHVATTSREEVYEEDWEWLLETYPSLKDKTYILSKPNNIVMDFAEERGIHHLDLVPLFKENPKYLHWPIDGHWNDDGQLFAGEKIKEYIIKNNLINNVK